MSKTTPELIEELRRRRAVRDLTIAFDLHREDDTSDPFNVDDRLFLPTATTATFSVDGDVGIEWCPGQIKITPHVLDRMRNVMALIRTVGV